MPIYITISIGLALILTITGLDIFLATDKIPHNTWSEIIRSWAKATPVIPFVCGVLSGHFFWPQSFKSFIPLLGQPGSVALLVWICCVVGILGLSLSRYGYSIPLWAAFVVGFVGGVLLWPVGKW